jgi:hypothetical protein
MHKLQRSKRHGYTDTLQSTVDLDHTSLDNIHLFTNKHGGSTICDGGSTISEVQRLNEKAHLKLDDQTVSVHSTQVPESAVCLVA